MDRNIRSPKKRRGPYKQYLHPENNAAVPESTLRSRKKRLTEQEIQEGGSNNDAQNTVANEGESEGIEESMDPLIESGTTAQSVNDMANPDEELDIDEDNNIQGKGRTTLDYVKKYSLNNPLYNGFLITKLEVLLMILHLAIRHSHTEQFVMDQIDFINCVFGTLVLDISYHIFKNLFPSSGSIVRHYFCPDCEIYLDSSETLKEAGVKKTKCKKCKSEIDVSSIDSSNYFVTLSIREQIENLLKKPDVKLINLTHRFTEGISDIFDGDLFKKLEHLQIPIENILTITFNTDGVRVHESTKNSMWPILVFVNELVPEQRFKVNNVILAGLWFGRSAPNMALFLSPFVEQMIDLSKNGVAYSKPDGQVVNCRVFPLACSVDSVAKAKILCQKQFNGQCGCLYCTHPNDATLEDFPNQRFYDTTSSYPLRTEKNVIQDMYKADELDRINELKDGSVNGFLGISVLLSFSKLMDLFSLNTFHIVWSVVIDYMHCVLEGVTSDLLELYMGILTSAQVETLNDHISKITLPQKMTRRPRPLSEKIHWKAREYRSFLLFYALPCLENLLPSRHFALLKLFVNAIHILLSDKISFRALSEAKSALQQFVCGFQRLYGLSHVKYNLHLLTHLCDLVYRLGPLWCYSNFVFESCNGRLVKFIKGTRSIINEIAVKFTKLQSVPTIIKENNVNVSVIEFCDKILGFDYVKNGLDLDEAFVTGSHSEVAVSADECILMEANNICVKDQKIKFYHRVVRDGIIYCSNFYSKAKVYNDSCVQLSDGQYAIIEKILITTGNQLVCLVTPLRIAGFIVPHIHRCTHDCFGDPLIIPFTNIQRKCVFITVESKKFVCDVPNFFERD